MNDVGRRSTVVGCIGLMCLAFFWTAALVPSVADMLPDSSLGKIAVVIVFLAAVPLTTVAAIRGSRWWWVAVAASALTFCYLCYLLSRLRV
jgi:hypothetical protein